MEEVEKVKYLRGQQHRPLDADPLMFLDVFRPLDVFSHLGKANEMDYTRTN